MFKSLSAPVYSLVLALAFVFATPHAAEAKSFKNFAGKYTGVLIIAQGPNPLKNTRIVGNANVKARANGVIIVEGTVNSVAFKQLIRLGPGSRATVSTLLPAIADFNQGLTGTFSGQSIVSVKGSFATTKKGGGPSPGKLVMKISKITFGGTLSIESKLTFDKGGDPVYVTIIAS
jgi:hypothetical protein